MFEFRTTSPDDMKAHPEPVGPENDAAIVEACRGVGMVVAGWDNDGRHLGRSAAILALIGGHGIALHALRISGCGEPWHPLFVGYDVQPRPWAPLSEQQQGDVHGREKPDRPEQDGFVLRMARKSARS